MLGSLLALALVGAVFRPNVARWEYAVHGAASRHLLNACAHYLGADQLELAGASRSPLSMDDVAAWCISSVSFNSNPVILSAIGGVSMPLSC
jgi:hypothetical protein